MIHKNLVMGSLRSEGLNVKPIRLGAERIPTWQILACSSGRNAGRTGIRATIPTVLKEEAR